MRLIGNQIFSAKISYLLFIEVLEDNDGKGKNEDFSNVDKLHELKKIFELSVMDSINNFSYDPEF